MASQGGSKKARTPRQAAVVETCAPRRQTVLISRWPQKVFVLYTGGTIGMTPSDPDNSSSWLIPGDANSLSNYIRKPDLQIWWDIAGLKDDNGRPTRYS